MAIILYLYDNRWCIQESVGTSGRISKFIESESAQGFEWRFLINNILLLTLFKQYPITQTVSFKSSSTIV